LTGSVTPIAGKRNVWDLRYERGFEKDANGVRRRKQRSVRFHGSRKQADARLRELVGDVERGQDVEPSKDTLIDWLREWHRAYVEGRLRPNTSRLYRMFIEEHVATSDIAFVQLQALRAPRLERFLAELAAAKKLSAASMQVYSGIVRTALAKAVKLRRIVANPALDVDRPRVAKDHRDLRVHCWSAIEARRLLAYAKERARPQLYTFVALALDTGARKSELAGLGWEHVNLETGIVRIERQLDTIAPLAFGPTKTCVRREVPVGPETLAALRLHHRAQAELRMRNRTNYVDNGLVFAKEFEDCVGDARLGDAITSLSAHAFQRICDDAGVRRVKFHGTRHTCATLLLGAGVPVHLVSKRLGHSSLSMTLDVYSHSLPDQSADAAAALAEVLWGRREPAAGESR